MRLLLLYCYYNYTLSYKNYQTLSSLFQDFVTFNHKKREKQPSLLNGSIIFVVGKSPMDIMEPILL